MDCAASADVCSCTSLRGRNVSVLLSFCAAAHDICQLITFEFPSKNAAHGPVT